MAEEPKSSIVPYKPQVPAYRQPPPLIIKTGGNGGIGEVLPWIALAGVISVGGYFLIKSLAKDDDNGNGNGADPDDWELLWSEISLDGNDVVGSVEINDDDKHELGANFSVKNYQFKFPDLTTWTTCVTVYDETNQIFVGHEWGDGEFSEDEFVEHVNIGKIKSDRRFTIKIWASQKGTPLSRPSPPQQSTWPLSSELETTASWSLLDVLQIEIKTGNGGGGFEVLKSKTCLNEYYYEDSVEEIEVLPEDTHKLGIWGEIFNHEYDFWWNWGWSISVTVYDETHGSAKGQEKAIGFLTDKKAFEEKVDIGRVLEPTEYTIKLWASQRDRQYIDDVPNSYFPKASTGNPTDWVCLDTKQITLIPVAPQFELLGIATSLNGVNRTGNTFPAGEENVKLGLHYTIQAPSDEDIWMTNVTVYNEDDSIAQYQTGLGYGSEETLRKEVQLGVVSRTTKFTIKLWATRANFGVVDASYYLWAIKDAPEGWVCLDARQVTLTVEELPGAVISLMIYPIGGGWVKLEPDKDIYENEHVKMTAYPTPPVMGSTETFEFNYWEIKVAGEYPEQSPSNPLWMYLQDKDIEVTAYFRRTHW